MNFLKCPFTDETIMKITPKGVFRTPLYSEVFLKLTDGSEMRIALSRNAKKNLKEKQVDEFFEKLRKERLNNLNGKAIDEKKKDTQKMRIENIGYTEVIDRGGLLFKKTKWR